MPGFDKLTDREMAQWRLRNQRLVDRRWTDPVAVVHGMLAVQAENFSQAGWALASRCQPAPTETEFHRLFDDGELLRTHVIRPTWHFVVRDDIVWLTELTAPRVHKSFIRSQQQQEGITDDERDRMMECAVDAIRVDGPLTRDDIAARLADRGLPASGAALILAMGMAETSALVCSGPRRNGAQTYDLIEHRAPNARRLDRDDALAELTVRYVTGHGPVTERDLSYWATLTLTDVRAGLAAVRDALASFDQNGITYWHRSDDEPPTALTTSAHILQILDEMYRGYHVESRWVVDHAGLVPRRRETSIGMALIDGQIVGTMTRTVSADRLTIELDSYRRLSVEERAALQQVADDYGSYCDRPAGLIIR